MKNIILLFLVLGSTSCIEDLGVFTGAKEALVIEGVVTNDFGPHRIRLAYTVAYNKNPPVNEVQAAKVIVIDDLGNETLLINRYEGFYETSDTFKGEEGRSYQLSVELRDGKKYRSLFEEMPDLTELNSVNYERTTKEILTADDVIIQKEVIAFSVDFCDLEGVENYYKWRYRETFEVLASKIPREYDVEGLKFTIPGACGASPVRDCWANGYDNNFLKIQDDLLIDGKEMKNFEVYQSDISRKFAEGYSIEIFQYNLTEKAYKYWLAIENQIGNNGTIFETSNYQIIGNIFSEDNEDELVLGYFEVSALSSKSVFIRPSEIGFVYEYICIPNPQTGCLPVSCIDCRQYSRSSTSKKPLGWPL